MDVSITFSLSSVYLIHNNLDCEEIITTVEGLIAFIAAYQQSQYDSNEEFLSKMDKNGHR